MNEDKYNIMLIGQSLNMSSVSISKYLELSNIKPEDLREFVWFFERLPMCKEDYTIVHNIWVLSHLKKLEPSIASVKYGYGMIKDKFQLEIKNESYDDTNG